MATKKYWVVRTQVIRQTWDEKSPTNTPTDESVVKQEELASFEDADEALEFARSLHFPG